MRRMKNILLIVLFACFMEICRGNKGKCIDTELVPDLNKCCTVPEPFMFTKSFVESCVSKHKALINDHDKFYTCLWDCIWSAYGLFDGNSIVQEKVLELTRSMEKVAQETVLFSVARCHKESNIINHRKNEKGNECDTFAFKYMFCIKKAILLNCPDKYWKIEPLCDEFDSGVPLCE
ncbi:uncharacterized protein LOC129749794 [Uranotaenia lowii]|uniref:uncharacterized protein LOC129749794 n=1 Tax=Uranotaenia lowii TaxID=190385 RepID=UPI00247AF313|nr:uncharacterized protein LOC129749794 [Uranotaenia lowii]